MSLLYIKSRWETLYNIYYFLKLCCLSMCKKYINHENYEITAIPEFSGEDVVEEVRMVSIKDLALVEV